MAPMMFSAEEFKLRRWWNGFSDIDGRFKFMYEMHLFLLGFITTMLVIYSIKKYREK